MCKFLWCNQVIIQWFCDVWTLSVLLTKGNCFLEGIIKVTEYCITDMLWILYTLEEICSVVLQV